MLKIITHPSVWLFFQFSHNHIVSNDSAVQPLNAEIIPATIQTLDRVKTNNYPGASACLMLNISRRFGLVHVELDRLSWLPHYQRIHEVDDGDDDDDVQNNQPNLCKFAYNRECNQNGISSPRFEYCIMLRRTGCCKRYVTTTVAA